MQRNRCEPNSKIGSFYCSQIQNFENCKKEVKNTIKLEQILSILLKKIFKIFEWLLI
jgi:hypothetical protein